jgi:energy-coupling factor transporter ATP-binding protein EcfA2
MFVDPINTASTIVSSYELSKKAIPLFGSIVRRIRNGKLNIVIFGAGGTGKSTLGKVLAGEFGIENVLQPYQMSVRTEQLQLDSKVPSSIVVVPGQPGYVSEWNEPLRQIANSQIDLIINVVSYGYHSFTRSGYASYQSHPDYQIGMTADNFVAIYSQNNRDLEMELLNKISPSLSLVNKKKTVMITLVTKQDLWWLNRQGVSDYYRSGEYDRVIRNIEQKLGSNNFKHQYISLSLLTENFRAGNSEILIPVAEGYEQKIQVLNLYQFLDFIQSTFDIQIGA